MSKVFVIIQARMTSTRLPNKVLLPLGKHSVLETMFLRLSNFTSELIVATTNDGTEQPIVNLCKKHNIRFYRGDTNDVLGRYFEAAEHYGATKNDIVVRLTSDCPFIDQTLLAHALKTFTNNSCDMVALGPHSGFPRGLDISVFHFSLLKSTHLQAVSQQDREHVTLGMPKIKDLKTININAKEDNSHYRITIDELADYQMLQSLYECFNFNLSFDYDQLIQTLKLRPDVAKINQHVEQKRY